MIENKDKLEFPCKNCNYYKFSCSLDSNIEKCTYSGEEGCDRLKQYLILNSHSCINDGGTRISYGEGMATREPSVGKGRYDLITPFGIERLAKWYELGSKKYSDRNWEKGMPFSRYIDSAKRHLNKYVMGMDDEDHLAAAAWNILAIIHHEELGQTELDDMPHYLKKSYNRNGGDKK